MTIKEQNHYPFSVIHYPLKNMTPTAQPEIIKLPSDQDASGRTFGAEEIAAVTEVLQSGILITTKGKYGKMLEEEFRPKTRRQIRLRLQFRLGGGSRRGCSDKSESRRRSRDDFDYRYGRADADYLSGRNSRFRRR